MGGAQISVCDLVPTTPPTRAELPPDDTQSPLLTNKASPMPHGSPPGHVRGNSTFGKHVRAMLVACLFDLMTANADLKPDCMSHRVGGVRRRRDRPGALLCIAVTRCLCVGVPAHGTNERTMLFLDSHVRLVPCSSHSRAQVQGLLVRRRQHGRRLALAGTCGPRWASTHCFGEVIFSSFCCVCVCVCVRVSPSVARIDRAKTACMIYT